MQRQPFGACRLRLTATDAPRRKKENWEHLNSKVLKKHLRINLKKDQIEDLCAVKPEAAEALLEQVKDRLADRSAGRLPAPPERNARPPLHQRAAPPEHAAATPPARHAAERSPRRQRSPAAAAAAGGARG